MCMGCLKQDLQHSADNKLYNMFAHTLASKKITTLYDMAPLLLVWY